MRGIVFSIFRKPCDIGGAKEPGMMYFLTKWETKELPESSKSQGFSIFLMFHQGGHSQNLVKQTKPKICSHSLTQIVGFACSDSLGGAETPTKTIFKGKNWLILGHA